MPRGKSPTGRHRLDVQQLRAFVSMADRGSVTSASRALGLAQSTVSESLAALERALGATVILRGHGSRHMMLTAAGKALLPHARAVVAAIDEAHSAVVAVTNRAHAAVEIIANESVSTYLLPRALSSVRRRWTNTRFSVTVAPCAHVRQGVEEGEFDLGLLLDSTLPNGSRKRARARTLADRHLLIPHVPLVIFVSPAHPLANGRTRSAVRRSTLAGYPLFLSDAAGEFHTLVERFFDADGIPGPRLEAAGTIEGVKQAVVEDSRALGILPAYAAANELARGQFARLDLQPPLPAMRLQAMLPPSRSSHPGLCALLDTIRRSFGDVDREGIPLARKSRS